jgi:hypothetical protein
MTKASFAAVLLRMALGSAVFVKSRFLAYSSSAGVFRPFGMSVLLQLSHGAL